MRTRATFLDCIQGGPLYEPISAYVPEREPFIAAVDGAIPASWQTKRSDIWYNAFPTGERGRIPREGWKIHMSSTVPAAEAALQRILPVLIARELGFKCALDRRMLALLSSKSWSRGASGKFVTIYPRDAEEFAEAIAALHAVTADLAGPYILSDRRYKDSKCLFYRYGSLTPTSVLRADGLSVPTLFGPNGETFEDVRPPVFALPPWVTDPFPDDEDDGAAAGTLNRGRYTIENALSFSNSGGVYVARDASTDELVLIKEARALACSTENGGDAIASLRKEYRLLRAMQDTGVVPKPIDYFTDWEHEFLVEELLQGNTFAALAASRGAFVSTLGDESRQRWYDKFRWLILEVARAVELFHERNIVLHDLSPQNVFILEGDTGVRIIDLEAACQQGVDAQTGIASVGYRLRDANGGTAFDTDAYALAALTLNAIWPITQHFELNRTRVTEAVTTICRDARIPAAVRDVLVRTVGLNSLSDARRDLSDVLDRETAIAPAQPDPPLALVAEMKALIEGVTKFILAHATPHRDDRLFPPDYRLFRTNALSLQSGALGTAAALHLTGTRLSDELMSWIERRVPETAYYAPGLAYGQAGVAWCLAELERLDLASHALDAARTSPLLAKADHSVMYGLAGYGMAQLRMFHATQDERYLTDARETAAEVLRRARRDEAGRPYWVIQRNGQDVWEYGLMHGASGVALFLLYLHLATRDEAYLAAGEQALRFDLAASMALEDGAVSWPYSTDLTRIYSPYVEYGSAGMASVIARYAYVTGGDDYRAIGDKVRLDLDRRYTILSGKSSGLAGIAGANLDGYAFTGDARYLDAVENNVRGIRIYQVDAPDGIAFPSSEQFKVGCDYGYGLAGILLLAKRIVDGSADVFSLDAFAVPEAFSRSESAA